MFDTSSVPHAVCMAHKLALIGSGVRCPKARILVSRIDANLKGLLGRRHNVTSMAARGTRSDPNALDERPVRS
jgi:hypothetical protein